MFYISSPIVLGAVVLRAMSTNIWMPLSVFCMSLSLTARQAQQLCGARQLQVRFSRLEYVCVKNRHLAVLPCAALRTAPWI